MRQINLKINNNIIQQAAFVKFLGGIIDEKLTWKIHIGFVHKKTIEAAALIAKLRHYTNKNTLKLIYYALVYPYLTYGNLIWGNTYQTKLQKILNVQKKIVRLISFKSYLEHSNPLFHNLKILNIFKINDYLYSLFNVTGNEWKLIDPVRNSAISNPQLEINDIHIIHA